ncbi:murein L,D-transpeptidase catalytic domain family protein [Prolixibacter sp. NT017]|uniref:murein L,D-transpeptidase catalytic domain family protein n=1 Tax=Prolixibacter sp. NT017 TaxID=2652390 RepID=UPI00127228A7|nr:murein L,D-transpeptidase catalytic domain family protein [Prolixibacter sp. NT017]GET25908.1 hypothetical protein NT017_22370 [Prolixibacter sp. NT017]
MPKNHFLYRFIFTFSVAMFLVGTADLHAVTPPSHPYQHELNRIDSLYSCLQPTDIKPSYAAFRDGLVGYYSIEKENKLENNRYLTLIDMSLASTAKRLWVIDLDSMKIVENTLVAHGRNTGVNHAVKFSNRPSSKMSSLGFYLTGATYHGKYGLSLYLDGIEPGINDKARERTIVMHSAPYATQKFVKEHGRLGRSWGCPAVPPSKSKAIIEAIKDKSCLFIYSPVPSYLKKSKYLGFQFDSSGDDLSSL